MHRTVTLAFAGAGLRGIVYARRAVASGRARIVAVAEPRPQVRRRFAAEFGISPEHTFATWEDMLGLPRLADAVVIGTQDTLHTGPAVAAA
ncbi:MAG: Gfo/Idh/MocA family oxidoreductase, partial [Stackebrandtia sp.]